MLIIGSRALVYQFPNIKRKVDDIDVIGFSDELPGLIKLLSPLDISKGKWSTILKNCQNKNSFFDRDNVEFIFVDDFESLKMYLDFDSNSIYASKEVLFSLKSSHIHYPIKFKKHIDDYILLHNYFNGVDSIKNITDINKKETKIRLGEIKVSSFNKNKEDFFKQSDAFVKRLIPHDTIHQIMSHYDEPLYKKLQKNQDLVKCDNELWDSLDYEDKIKCILEEVYVIALERKIIPMLFFKDKHYTSFEAFEWALGRICTNLWSGKSRSFATVNYRNIISKHNPEYVEKFLMQWIKMKNF